jgi:hypothetical protein
MNLHAYLLGILGMLLIAAKGIAVGGALTCVCILVARELSGRAAKPEDDARSDEKRS